MVARYCLVIGQRLQAPTGPGGHVAQVDPVDARPGAVQRGRIVKAARRGRLGEHRDAPDFHRLRRDGGEILRHQCGDLRHLGVQIVQQLGAALVAVGIQEAGVLAQRDHALTHGALGHALGLQDGVHLGTDPIHLPKADGVDGVGVQIAAAQRGDGCLIERRAVRHCPDAGFLTRAVHQPRHGLPQPAISGVDDGFHGGQRVRLQRLACALGQSGGLQLAHEAGVQAVVGRGGGGEAVQHGQRAFDQHAGRGSTGGGIGLNLGDDGIERAAEVGQPGDVVARLLGRGYLLLGGHLVGDFDGRPGNLVDQIGRVPDVPKGIDAAIGNVGSPSGGGIGGARHIHRHLVGVRQAGTVDSVQLRHEGIQQRPPRGRRFGRIVAQPAGMRAAGLLGGQPVIGGQLRVGGQIARGLIVDQGTDIGLAGLGGAVGRVGGRRRSGAVAAGDQRAEQQDGQGSADRVGYGHCGLSSMGVCQASMNQPVIA